MSTTAKCIEHYCNVEDFVHVHIHGVCSHVSKQVLLYVRVYHVFVHLFV